MMDNKRTPSVMDGVNKGEKRITFSLTKRRKVILLGVILLCVAGCCLTHITTTILGNKQVRKVLDGEVAKP
ncbi:hypothetical protein [Sporomusa silvacetica]|uniref:hypothetical protein n=1 Tax=Sporomusa silvacetica TaxID=55504 RepID=UPI000B99E33C|nr:hypothetical protein [Sporomusa silvacetica]